MKIELKSLTLTNFKGIKQLQVKFEHETAIFGANATGKTTVFDAFLWNLFGKDSGDREVFGIKTYDAEGKVIPMLEHEVISQIAVWNADDNDLPRVMIFKRTLREVWQKPRGQAEAIYKGNETIYNVDAVPCTQKEYNERVNGLSPENIFKLLTNPAYFPGLNWTLQRQSLFSLVPEITNLDIIKEIPAKTRNVGKFDELMKMLNAATNVLNSEKLLADHKKKISADKRLLNEELEKIPSRIDEVERGKPVPEDWATLEQGIKDAEAYILRKNGDKTNKLSGLQAETEKRAVIQNKINASMQSMTMIKNGIEDSIKASVREAKQKADEHRQYLSDYGDLIQKSTNALKGYELDMEALQGERAKLINEWKSINAEAMPTHVVGMCPTCGQELPDDFKQKTLEEHRKSYLEGKAGRLETNKKKGQNVAGQIVQKQTQIDETKAKIEKLKADLDAVRQGWEGDPPSEIMGASGASPAAILFVTKIDEALKVHEEYQKLSKDLEADNKKLDNLGPVTIPDTSSIEKEIGFASNKLSEDRVKLSKRDQIIKADQRKAELEARQKDLSQQIAALEQVEFTMETFNRTKVNMLEEKINSMFSLVKFKMFNIQVNGELSETCECTVNGVPYSDLNNAARINAGIDIINTMSLKYGIIAPIWIDNRESVNKIIDTKAQLIHLYVIPPLPEAGDDREASIAFYKQQGILLS
jgi:hypothetical protein